MIFIDKCAVLAAIDSDGTSGRMDARRSSPVPSVPRNWKNGIESPISMAINIFRTRKRRGRKMVKEEVDVGMIH